MRALAITSSQDLAPLLEALVRGEHRRGPFVAATHELAKEHRAGPRDREIADLVDHQEAREDERLEAVAEAPGLLRFLERRDEVGEGAVVHAPATLRRGARETDREMTLADARWAEEDDILVALDEASVWRLSTCSRLSEG